MPWFAKKQDPLDRQAQTLTAQISRLEAEIDALAQAGEQSARTPRVRSTAYGSVVMGSRFHTEVPPVPTTSTVPVPKVPVDSPLRPLRTHPGPAPKAPSPSAASAASAPTGLPQDPHFNELGVRKYDLVSWWERVRNHLHGPTSNNPRMVQFLAAGSIQGLRPLRYERRVARNRFLAFFSLLLLILWGLAFVYIRQRSP